MSDGERQPGEKRAEEPETGDLRHQARATGAALLHHAITGLLVAGALAVGVWSYLATLDSGDSPGDATAESITARAGRATTRTRIEWALEIHLIHHNDYPANLKILVDRGLLRSDDLYYPDGTAGWMFARQADSFELSVRTRSD